ncbi:MAG TPA: SRPBCC domain-containing protein [Anaeromyxobacter sp.]
MNPLNIDVSRLIRASPDEVFRAWTDAERFRRWFGTTRQIVDLKVDGLFFLAMEHQGRTWPHYGRFVRLDRPKVVEFTWMSEGTQGVETTVTVKLAPRDGGTQLTLEHVGVPDTELGRGHQEGWTAIVGEIAKALEKA